MKRNKNYIALAIVVLIGTLYYIFVRITGKAIPCVVYSLTGFNCSGCGLTRMVMSLSKGDIITAFRENAVVMCLIPVWMVIFLIYKTNILKKYVNREKILEKSMVVSVIVFVLFGILRNIPFFEVLRPI